MTRYLHALLLLCAYLLVYPLTCTAQFAVFGGLEARLLIPVQPADYSTAPPPGYGTAIHDGPHLRYSPRVEVEYLVSEKLSFSFAGAYFNLGTFTDKPFFIQVPVLV